MHYFGTALDNHGHYHWELTGDSMAQNYGRWDQFGFDSEKNFVRSRGAYITKGETSFRHENGYSIYAIEGSCKDERWGTCSVFFVKGTFEKDALKEMIMRQPMACKLISKMPFEVKW